MKQTLLFMIVAVYASSSASAQNLKISAPKKPIICLTYDDGLFTQLTTALPQLDSAGLKATFFLTAIQGSSQSDVIGQTPEVVLGWHNAAINGHELANHTLFHPCPMKLGWDKSLAIDNYTLKQIVEEIKTQNNLLSLLDPHRVKRAYAFPCNNDIIEGKDYSLALEEKKLVTYARTGGDSASIITDFAHMNTMKVPSWLVLTGTSTSELISFAEKVKKAGGMGVYQFHGIGGQIFQISADTHREFLAYLKANEREFNIMTFSEAMDGISNNKQ
jgi:peptidoglycan-N-acetylglucosamine deacetylase